MRFLYFSFLVLAVFIASCTERHQNHNEQTSDAVIKKIVSVYDGDTFRVALQGWPDYLGDDIGIRVRGIDAPEIRGKCEAEKKQARQARDFTKRLLQGGNKVTLKNIKPGKYFRLVADVYIDGTLLSQTLIQKGYARAYDGGQRQSWCS